MCWPTARQGTHTIGDCTQVLHAHHNYSISHCVQECTFSHSPMHPSPPPLTTCVHQHCTCMCLVHMHLTPPNMPCTCVHCTGTLLVRLYTQSHSRTLSVTVCTSVQDLVVCLCNVHVHGMLGGVRCMCTRHMHVQC